jgi:hypothetical protein
MHTEEEFVELVKQLKPVESALLNWAVDLMADVVVEEDYNKMDARNIAMVFAPNMTQVCLCACTFCVYKSCIPCKKSQSLIKSCGIQIVNLGFECFMQSQSRIPTT